MNEPIFQTFTWDLTSWVTFYRDLFWRLDTKCAKYAKFNTLEIYFISFTLMS